MKTKLLMIALLGTLLFACHDKSDEKLKGVWGIEEKGERIIEVAIFEHYAKIYDKDIGMVQEIMGDWKSDKHFQYNPMASSLYLNITDDGKLDAPQFMRGFLEKFSDQLKTKEN